MKGFTSPAIQPARGEPAGDANGHVTDVDVLVVGAGPAGAASAYHLARHGVDVLVVDKAQFPREKVCGDGLTPRGVAAASRMGVDMTEPGFVRVDGLRVFGPSDVERRGGAISFAIEGMHPHDVAEICDREAVCIRAGHHCAQPLMRRLGVAATARASFHVYNERGEIDRLVDALGEARRVFGLG